MKIDINNAEKFWKKAIKMLNSDCPEKSCEWCGERVKSWGFLGIMGKNDETVINELKEKL